MGHLNLRLTDIIIIGVYFVATILIGLWVSRRGSKDLDSYVLGGKSLPWYLLGISDASGMFDISGTMALVYWLFVYGLKSIWLPYLWPVFNQIFLMMFMSAWVRRSNVMTGAQWIETRFGRDTGASLAHLSVVAFALINVVAMLAYAFKGIGEFAAGMLPPLTAQTTGLLSNDNLYALIIMGLTSLYAIKGGMMSVVITEVMQFTILTITSIVIGIIAINKVSPDMIAGILPAGWSSPFFGRTLGIEWTGAMKNVNEAVKGDGYNFFSLIFGMMMIKGVLASLAGPAPNYDMQRILATRTPREACMMNGWVCTVLYVPRYLMVAGITVIALAFCQKEIGGMGSAKAIEGILPTVLIKYMPVGVLGFLLAGLMAALMSNFAATLNAAPAYIVNDIYKRFINPHSTPRRDVFLSRIASVVVLFIGVGYGLMTQRLVDIMGWIIGAFLGAFVTANVLKWIWWRFNGYGYFWGMLAGTASSIFFPWLFGNITHPGKHAVWIWLAKTLASLFGKGLVDFIAFLNANDLYTFPLIFGLSAVGCIWGTLATGAEDDEILKSFYRTVRPWGFWGPILKKVQQDDPNFKANPNFVRDMTNVAVGIVWQLCLVAFPIYLVLRDWKWVGVTAAIIAASSIYLKFTWYDHLHEHDTIDTANTKAAQRRAAAEIR